MPVMKQSSAIEDGGGSTTMVDKGESSNLHREKKVVLFGKTGVGKSTIANALVTGGIDEIVFKSSNGAQGCTQEFLQVSRRGWNVLDTIGLGEAAPKGDIGSSDRKPEERLKAYLKEVRGEYSHIIYVINGGRFTTIDEMIWTLFAEIFKGGEAAFVILFTGVDERWLQTEDGKLPDFMKTVQNKLAVNIPPKHKVHGIERLQAKKRREEIQKLEKKLDFFFKGRSCEYVRPKIVDLDEDDLLIEAKSIIERVVKKIKNLFKGKNLVVVIRVLSTVVGLALAVASLVTQV